MNVNVKTLILSALTMSFFVACSPLSVDGDLPLPELSSAEALTLCEDIEDGEPIDCNDEGENEKWIDFDVRDCQELVKLAPEGCSMTAEQFYDLLTEDACGGLAKFGACYNGK